MRLQLKLSNFTWYYLKLYPPYYSSNKIEQLGEKINMCNKHSY